jgi:hypothetical protein
VGGEHGGPVEHAGDVHVDRTGEGRGIGVGQGSHGTEKAGVVHPEVDAAEPSDHGGGEALERSAVGDIDGGQDRQL